MGFPMAAMGIGASGLGGVTGAIGSVFGGEAQKSMYEYQAAVARINAGIAEQNASYAIAAGEAEAQQQGMKTRAEIGQTRATQGASGLDVNRGSAVDVRASEAEVGAMDQAMVRANAQRQAYGYRVQAMQETAQAQLDQMAGQNAQTAGIIGSFTSLLGGASGVSSKWMQATQLNLLS